MDRVAIRSAAGPTSVETTPLSIRDRDSNDATGPVARGRGSNYKLPQTIGSDTARGQG